MRSLLVTHADHAFTLLAPRCSDALIDDAAFAADERLPYWADLWPSSVALARWVLDAPSLPTRAIELGCGLGLVALALTRRGVDVLATDYEPEALRFVRINVEGNRLAGAEGRVGEGLVHVREFDWRSDDHPAPAPLIVGADLLYEERNVAPLAALIPRLVADGGRAVIADPGRRWCAPFEAACARAGFVVTLLRETMEAGTAPGARPSRVRLVELRRP